MLNYATDHAKSTRTYNVIDPGTQCPKTLGIRIRIYYLDSGPAPGLRSVFARNIAWQVFKKICYNL
jgi:hypothetical protein